MAERVGFEPTVRCRTQHFQCCQLSHSCTFPNIFDFGFLICDFNVAIPCVTTIKNPQSKIQNVNGGEGGIRTHGGRKATPVFETGALIHYATSPDSRQKEKSKGKT